MKRTHNLVDQLILNLESSTELEKLTDDWANHVIQLGLYIREEVGRLGFCVDSNLAKNLSDIDWAIMRFESIMHIVKHYNIPNQGSGISKVFQYETTDIRVPVQTLINSYIMLQKSHDSACIKYKQYSRGIGDQLLRSSTSNKYADEDINKISTAVENRIKDHVFCPGRACL